MLTYDLDDAFVSLSQMREKFAALAESNDDCVGTLCALTDTGEWVTAVDGTMEYRCDAEGEEELGLSDGVNAPVAAYRVGGYAIPNNHVIPFAEFTPAHIRHPIPLSAWSGCHCPQTVPARV